jgi:hypothetical protein
LVAYEHCVEHEHRYFTTRFVDGLKNEIKSVVLVQRPADLDTACALALLQEEAESAQRKDFKRTEFAFNPKPALASTPLPLPLPLPRSNKSLGGGQGVVVPLIILMCIKQRTRWLLFGITGVPGISVSIVQRNGFMVTNALLRCSYRQCRNYGNYCLMIMRMMVAPFILKGKLKCT